jgi:hypothetical protein
VQKISERRLGLETKIEVRKLEITNELHQSKENIPEHFNGEIKKSR